MSIIKYVFPAAGTTFLGFPAVIPTDVAAHGVRAASDRPIHQGLSIPSSVEAEHEELHAHLATVLGSGGQTGLAAKEVAKLLHPHFVKEEEFAMPPLGLLSGLANGELPDDADKVIRMTDRLKAAMPEMLREHQEITAALQKLRETARVEGKQDVERFADDLIAHATQEEQILYPSAILVGEYLKLRR